MSGVAGARILVVDDSQPMREFLEARLTAAGCRVRTASSGSTALRLAEEQPPDLVLLDVAMPGLNGLEVCEELKQQPLTATVPVVMVSGLRHPANVQRAQEVGAEAYVLKPFDEDELLSVVGAVLDRHRLCK